MVKITFSWQEKILLFILAAVQFNHIVDFMILMPLGPQLMRIFSISTNQFSWLVSIYTLCAGIAGFAVSFIIDRFDRKKLLIFFLTGFCLGTLACGLAPTYSMLLWARGITGCFGGVMNSVVLSIVSDAIPYEKRGTAMGVISTSFSLASVMGVPFALYLANLLGWHSSFICLAALSIFVLIGTFVFVPAQKRDLLQFPAKPILDPLLHVIKSKELLWALSFAGLLVLGQFMVIPFLSPSLVANTGMLESQLPLVYLVGGALTFITGPLVGRLSDSYGKHVVFRYGLISAAIVTLLLTSWGVHSVNMTLVVVGLFFICVNARWVPALAMISGVASPEYRGSFMSYVGCIQQLMAAFGAVLSGWIVVKNETTGYLENYMYVGYVAVCVSFVALWLSSKVVVYRAKSTNVSQF